MTTPAAPTVSILNDDDDVVKVDSYVDLNAKADAEDARARSAERCTIRSEVFRFPEFTLMVSTAPYGAPILDGDRIGVWAGEPLTKPDYVTIATAIMFVCPDTLPQTKYTVTHCCRIGEPGRAIDCVRAYQAQHAELLNLLQEDVCFSISGWEQRRDYLAQVYQPLSTLPAGPLIVRGYQGACAVNDESVFPEVGVDLLMCAREYNVPTERVQ